MQPNHRTESIFHLEHTNREGFWSWKQVRGRVRHALVLVIISAGMIGARAEDSDRFRPYFRFHSGDIEPLWGVDDHWSLGFGANFNRYLGAELAFDYYLKDWGEPKAVAEASSYHI